MLRDDPTEPRSDVVTLIGHVHEERRDRTFIVVNLNTLELIEFDDIGRAMWSGLRRTSSIDETVLLVLEEFDAEHGQVEADLRRFVSELSDVGLVASDVPVPPIALATPPDTCSLYLDLMERSLLGLLTKATGENASGPTMDSILAGTAIDHWWKRGMPGMTMIGFPRLRNVRALAERVLDDQIPGDFVETGVWRGGRTIMMKAVLEARGDTSRRVWVCDSFEGLPVPDVERYPDDAFWAPGAGEIAVPLESVRENFAAHALLDDRVEFLKGWFQDTMPMAPIDEIALLRLDGDLYQSTMEVLEGLYAKVAPGGFVIIDDYYFDSCRNAVDDFRHRKGITAELQVIDWSGVFWQVPQL